MALHINVTKLVKLTGTEDSVSVAPVGHPLFVQQFFPLRDLTNLSEDLINYSESGSEDEVQEV